MSPRITGILFWVSVVGCIFDVFMMTVTGAVPALRAQSDLFMVGAILFGVGAIANYFQLKSVPTK